MSPIELDSQPLPRFWALYRALPAGIRERARAAFQRFLANPAHPSLEFKQLQGYPGYWSVRVTRSYRAVCHRSENTLFWFWIGSHADFDREFA